MTKEINLFSSEQETSQLRKSAPRPSYQPASIDPAPLDNATAEEKPTEECRTARSIIEAILFASPEPLTLQKIREALDPFLPLKPKALESILNSLKNEYILERRGFRLSETAEGFVLKTPEEMGPLLESVFKNRRGERLSQAAAEVLAIIVHRQPITRAQVEAIRGVDCTGTIAALSERGLINQVGKAEAPGRPSLWAVTPSFLTHFGLKDLKELQQEPLTTSS